jgi:hypothetical protein
MMSHLEKQLGIDGDARTEAGLRSVRHAHANQRCTALLAAIQGVAGAMNGFASNGVAGVEIEADYSALKANVATYLRDAATNIEGLA